MMSQPSIATLLFGVVDTQVWSMSQLRTWADTQIEAASAPSEWLLVLSLSSTHEEAAAAIRQLLRERGSTLPEDVSDLLVGLTYMRFLHDQLSRREMVAAVGDILDAYGSFIIDVEGWYEQAGAEAGWGRELADTLSRLASEADAYLSLLDEPPSERPELRSLIED